MSAVADGNSAPANAALGPASGPQTAKGARVLAGTASSRPRRPSFERAAEEAAWLHEVSAGDLDALGRLWRQYRLPCLQLARRVLGSDAHSEDVVQLVFLDVWRQAGRFDPARASVGSWLLTMTHHKAVDRVRYEQRRVTETPDPSTAAPADCHDPQDLAVEDVRRQAVRQALLRLTAAQRETLVLAYFGGLTYQEISNRIGVPVGTIKTRGRAGLIRLRALLEPPEDC